MTLSAVTMLVALLSVSAGAQAESAITVFVGPAVPTTSHGFTEPVPRPILDSVKDIQNRLRFSKGLRLVKESGRADIVLRVIDRRVHSSESGAVVMPIGSMVVALPLGEVAIVSTILSGGCLHERNRRTKRDVAGVGRFGGCRGCRVGATKITPSCWRSGRSSRASPSYSGRLSEVSRMPSPSQGAAKRLSGIAASYPRTIA